MHRVGLVMVVAVACAVGLPAVAPPAAGAVLQVTIPAPDFNADGFADLAVGAPGEDVGAATDAGAVNVLYGSAAGITGAGSRLLTQANPEPGDGSALFGAEPGGLGDGGGQFFFQGGGGLGGAAEAADQFGGALS